MRAPILKGRSIIINMPLIVSDSAACAANAIANEPIPIVATSALTSTSKRPNRIIIAIPARIPSITLRSKGTAWVKSLGSECFVMCCVYQTKNAETLLHNRITVRAR